MLNVIMLNVELINLTFNTITFNIITKNLFANTEGKTVNPDGLERMDRQSEATNFTREIFTR